MGGCTSCHRAHASANAKLLVAPPGPTPPLAPPARLVVANILAHVIVEFFEQGLERAVAPGGVLILSGVLRVQTPDIRARLQWCGLEQAAQEQAEDWVCIVARRA